MFMTPLTNAQIDAYNASGATAGANNNSDPQAAQDKFLTMLVAQLNNQDPLNPMDNAQMTTQMAQINTVSGIQELNKTLTSMAAQFGSMQSLQGVSLIGRQAVVEGKTALVQDGTVKGGLQLATAADTVRVDVMGKAGQLLGSVALGAKTTGQHFFDIPLESLSGVKASDVASFTVTAQTNGKAVTATPLSLNPVTAVGMEAGAMKLTSASGASFAYDKVLSFR
jgi:flagellar basal-body rod modification protein FlgD